jgi:hypothetical protein
LETPARPERDNHGDPDGPVVGLELDEVLVEVVVVGEAQVPPLGLDGRKPGALLKPGRGFERGDLPVEGGELRVGAPSGRQVIARGRLGEGGERVFRGLDRFAARGIGEPRELETVEVPLRFAVGERLLGARDFEPGAFRIEIRPAPFAGERRDAPEDRLARFEVPPGVFDLPAVRPVAAVGKDEGARGRGAGSGGGGSRPPREPRRERLGARAGS